MTEQAFDSGLGPWDPLTPFEVASVLESCAAPWWVAGGYAIDAFVGRFDRRPHEDVDVGLLARDQQVARRCLAGCDFHCADPPGHLRPWKQDEHLSEPVHDVWVRERAEGPWRLQLVLNPSDGDLWVYRRDPRITRPVSELVFEAAGISYLLPEVQLLFKSKTGRPKDEQDFDDALPLLDRGQRAWLRWSLELANAGHPWLARL